MKIFHANTLLSNYGHDFPTRTQWIQNSTWALNSPKNKHSISLWAVKLCMHRKNVVVLGRREAAGEMKLLKVTRKGINNANTIRERRWRRREVSHSANHCCAHWCRRRTWGRSLTFGPWRGDRGKLLRLVVEGRCCDFEVEGGGHHVRLITAGVLHVAVSIGGEQNETKLAKLRYRKKKIIALLCTWG